MAHAAAMSCGAALAGVQHLPEVYTWFSHGLEWRSLNQRGSGAGAADMKYLHRYIIHKRTCVCALSHWWGLQLLNVYLIFWRPSNKKSGWVWRAEGWGRGRGGDKKFTCFFNYTSFVIRSKLHIRALARSRCQTKQSSLSFQTSVQQGHGNLRLIFLAVDFQS